MLRIRERRRALLRNRILDMLDLQLQKPHQIDLVSATKIAVSIDKTLLLQLDRLVKSQSFSSRSEAVQEAISEKISRTEKSALLRECAKLDIKSEQAMADEGLVAEISSWPKY
jgi:Arc/MetJ-type ribon-helix-helix transcriptional regulator